MVSARYDSGAIFHCQTGRKYRSCPLNTLESDWEASFDSEIDACIVAFSDSYY